MVMSKEDGPWEPGDELDWPHKDNQYISRLLEPWSYTEQERSDCLSRIGQEWLDEISQTTSPFSDAERAMMAFIANTLVEGNPTERIKSMSCTLGDVQGAVASMIYGSVEFDLNNDRSSDAANALYDTLENQFLIDPGQPGIPYRQRAPGAWFVYKDLTNVEFELANTSHSENVLGGRKLASLPITDLDYDGDNPIYDRATRFLGIFINATLRDRLVRESFLDTRLLRKRIVINCHFV